MPRGSVIYMTKFGSNGTNIEQKTCLFPEISYPGFENTMLFRSLEPTLVIMCKTITHSNSVSLVGISQKIQKKNHTKGHATLQGSHKNQEKHAYSGWHIYFDKT